MGYSENEYQIDFSDFYNPTLICLTRRTSDKEYIHNVQGIVDFLRRKGYAIPWNNLSVKELVKRNWLILK